ncbi:MAG: FAD-dependent monooxygenase [Acidobacteriaceae bacterium]|nr:FAD-dependent monooxygenase [Acidobacteriaceae bacterium]
MPSCRNLDFDIGVVGGGPAGLAASIALRAQGFSVALFDCAVPPIDKACGEGLMPDGLAALGELGVSVPSYAGFPLQGIRFVDAANSVTADFPSNPGVGVLRTVLHQLLADRAREAGVSVRWGIKGLRVSSQGISLDGRLLRSRLVIGADGQNSVVRRNAGLTQVREKARRYGFRRHYRLAPWSPHVELHWGTRSQLYITPVSRDEICVALLTRDSKVRPDDALNDFPEVCRRLASAAPCSPVMGALTISRTCRRVCREGFALVGDASGSVDAITGHGLTLAFRQALALATALKRNQLEQYQKAHRALSRRSRIMSSLLLALEAHGAFRKRALTGLSKQPEVFAAFVSFHAGASPAAVLSELLIAPNRRAQQPACT